MIFQYIDTSKVSISILIIIPLLQHIKIDKKPADAFLELFKVLRCKRIHQRQALARNFVRVSSFGHVLVHTLKE